MKITVLAYIPVLHQGYLDVLRRYSSGNNLVILDGSLLEKLGERKDIRALEASLVAHIISSLGLFEDIRVIGENTLHELPAGNIIALNDSACRTFVRQYIIPSTTVIFDTAFLRWDKDRVSSIAVVDHDRVSSSEFDRSMMELARKTGVQTSDWWRQVGGVIVKNRTPILVAHNRHLPDEHAPYFAGDPRDQILAGMYSELASAIHAEQSLIADAARNGISLKGTDIYVTTFPCPLCAKLIAEGGIQRCFYQEGHVSLDGEQNLKEKGVEIILVN